MCLQSYQLAFPFPQYETRRKLPFLFKSKFALLAARFFKLTSHAAISAVEYRSWSVCSPDKFQVARKSAHLQLSQSIRSLVYLSRCAAAERLA